VRIKESITDNATGMKTAWARARMFTSNAIVAMDRREVLVLLKEQTLAKAA